MFKMILKKEILTRILDGTFLFFAIFCFVVTIVTIVRLVPQHPEALAAYFFRSNGWNDEVRREIETFEDYGLRFRELNVYKRPPELGVFASGVEGALEDIFRVMGMGRVMGRRDRKADLLTFESDALVPDFTYVVSMLLSLIAILFASTSIARERRDGTLRLLLSNPVPRATVILGKYVSEMVILSVLLLIVFLLEVGSIVGSGMVELGWDLLLRCIGMLGAALVYLSVFVLAGILVSCLARSFAVSTVSALLVWVFLVVLYPSLGQLVGSSWVEAPRLYELGVEYKAIGDEGGRTIQERLRPYYEQVIQSRQEAMRKGERSGPSPALQEEMNKVVREVGHSMAQRVTQSQERARQKRAQQVEAAMNWARLSPTTSYLFLTSALSGTGLYRQQGFMESVKRYVQQLSDYFEQLGYDVVNGEVKYRPVNIQELPHFRERNATWGEIWVDARVDLLLLILFNVVVFLACHTIFLWMDIAESP